MFNLFFQEDVLVVPTWYDSKKSKQNFPLKSLSCTFFVLSKTITISHFPPSLTQPGQYIAMLIMFGNDQAIAVGVLAMNE